MRRRPSLALVRLGLALGMIVAACSSHTNDANADLVDTVDEAVQPGDSPIPDTEDPLPPGVEYAPLDATLDTIVDGFGIPWAIEVLGQDEYLVSERLGALVHVLDGQRSEIEGLPPSQTIFADPLVVGGTNDVSLHPRFDENGLVYLAYVDDLYRMVVARFDFSDRTVRDLEVIFETERVLGRVAHRLAGR